MNLGAIFDNMVWREAERKKALRKERREKLIGKVLKCPKCGCTNIQVEEVVKAVSQHRVIDGVWEHRYDNNEIGDGIGVYCMCDKCQHEWVSRRGINFDNYYLSENP